MLKKSDGISPITLSVGWLLLLDPSKKQNFKKISKQVMAFIFTRLECAFLLFEARILSRTSVADTAVIIRIGPCNLPMLIGFLSASTLTSTPKASGTDKVEPGGIRQPSDSPIAPNVP
jgi:hypothetical protein